MNHKKIIPCLIAGVLLLFPGGELPGETKEFQDWKKCDSSAGCVVIRGACEWECVSKEFQQEAEEYYREIQTRVRCASGGFERTVEAQCQEGLCVCQDVFLIPSVYYQDLLKRCAGDGCCEQSVRVMSEHEYRLMSNEGCPEGFEKNLLRCVSSYAWCEPVDTNR